MKLGLKFYKRPALQVARDLLGQILVHEERGRRRTGRIVETEAYIGPHDLACHASRGRTARTEVLFGPPGVAYVYLIYGMHHCFNAVVEPEGVGAAVLVRGVELLSGVRAGTRGDGPGRLCRAMGIGMARNRSSLLDPAVPGPGAVWIEEGAAPSRRSIRRGPRVGVEYAGDWADKPYRFWVRGSPGVSRAGRAADE